MELNEKIAALESENAALRAKLSKSEGARQAAQIYLDDAKEHCRNEVQNLRHKLSGYINKVANLEQKLEQKLPKISIDYSKVGGGEAPFDGRGYLIHDGEALFLGAWNEIKSKFDLSISTVLLSNNTFTEDTTRYMTIPTHYTPLPEFEEKKESE